MEVFAVEQQLCPCYTERQEFQKIVELKDNGLVVYCHRTCTGNIRQAEVVGSVINTSRDVFILHNKKDVKITTSQLTSELEKKNISCPRCRKRFEHVQKLMKEVKSIDKKIVMSICDHCYKRAPVNKKTFCACKKIVNLFKTVLNEQTKDSKKYLKVLPSKMGHLRKDKEKIRAYINSPASEHELEIQQLFYSDRHFQLDDTEVSETDSKCVCIEQAVAFIESIKPMQTNIPDISLVDSDTTFVETYVGVKELPRPSITNHNQEKKIEDTPSIDAKEELKRRHDISLRQMVKLEKDSRAPFLILKRPDVYESPKIAPWVQKEPTPKYHVEPKHDRDSQNLEYVSNKLIKFGSSRNIQNNLQNVEKSNLDRYHHDKMKKGLYISTAVKLSGSVEKVKKPQFSFVFPKVEEKKKEHINLDVSSSQLIKDTQERLRLESERLKRKQEEERQQKLEQEKKIKLAREEKKRQAEEKKRLAEQEKKKIVEEQQRLAKRHKSRDSILGKEGESDGVKKHTVSKPKHDEQDGVKEKAMGKVGDLSKPDGIGDVAVASNSISYNLANP